MTGTLSEGVGCIGPSLAMPHVFADSLVFANSLVSPSALKPSGVCCPIWGFVASMRPGGRFEYDVTRLRSAPSILTKVLVLVVHRIFIIVCACRHERH